MGISDYYSFEFVKLSRSSEASGLKGDEGSYSEVSGTEYKGRIRRLRMDERIINNSETAISTHLHWYPSEVELSRHDKIRCKTGTLAGDYDVIPIGNIHNHHNKAELRIIEE